MAHVTLKDESFEESIGNAYICTTKDGSLFINFIYNKEYRSPELATIFIDKEEAEWQLKRTEFLEDTEIIQVKDVCEVYICIFYNSVLGVIEVYKRWGAKINPYRTNGDKAFKESEYDKFAEEIDNYKEKATEHFIAELAKIPLLNPKLIWDNIK